MSIDLLQRVIQDAQYLSASADKFQRHGEVHISHNGAREMLKNYTEVIALLQMALTQSQQAGVGDKPLVHPMSVSSVVNQPPKRPSPESQTPEQTLENPIQRLEALRIKSIGQLEKLHSTEQEHLESLHQNLSLLKTSM